MSCYKIGMARSTRRALGPIVFIVCFLLVFEGALRIQPEWIPLDLLRRFQRDLRGEIAQRRSLWHLAQMREIERDDGGPTLRVFKPHSKIRYEFRDARADEDEEGTRLFDSIGFCNAERDDPTRARIDVVVLGDSFGCSLVLDPESSWVSQIGVLAEVPVLNLSRGGIGPYEYIQILRKIGLPKNPEVVVMQIYEGNDLRDSRRYHEHVEAARSGRTLYQEAGDRRRDAIDYDRVLDVFIGRHSYAVNLFVVVVAEGASALRRLVSGDVRSSENFRYVVEFPERPVAMNVQNADESEVRQARAVRDGQLDLHVFDAALERLSQLAEQHDFTPLVTYAPSAHTAYAEFVEFEDDSLRELMPWMSETQRAYLRGRCEELGLEFLDLTPALQRAARVLGPDRLLYYPINIHWTTEGDRVVSETVAPVVARLHEERTRASQASAASFQEPPRDPRAIATHGMRHAAGEPSGVSKRRVWTATTR